MKRLQAPGSDVVAFQEAVRTESYDQCSDILAAGYHLAHQERRAEDGSGITVASRWPIDHVDEVDLRVTPRTEGFPCGALLAEIRLPDPVGRMLLVNHKPSWEPELERERELQAGQVMQAVEDRLRGQPMHVIVAGDFDAEPDAPSVKRWRGGAASPRSRQYLDAWQEANGEAPGHTFTPRNPCVPAGTKPRRIDYILVRDPQPPATAQVISAQLLLGEPVDSVWASDHFGMQAEIRVGVG